MAAVTLNLWDGVIRSRLRQWVSDRLGLDEQVCGRWLAFWSGAHDIGKVSPCFQDRGQNNTAALRDQLGPAWFTSTVGNELSVSAGEREALEEWACGVWR